MSRLEKKVWNRNIPVGQYEIRDQLAVREDYQKAIDPELRQRESLLTEAQRLRQRTLAEHAQLSAELEAFMPNIQCRKNNYYVFELYAVFYSCPNVDTNT